GQWRSSASARGWRWSALPPRTAGCRDRQLLDAAQAIIPSRSRRLRGNTAMADDAPMSKPASAFGLNPTDDLHDLRMSEAAMPLLEHVKAFIKETVNPM